MRTTTVIVIEKTKSGFTYGTYCNNPDYEMENPTPVDETLTVPVGTMEECGGCGGYHRPTFFGDCRDDDERFWPID